METEAQKSGAVDDQEEQDQKTSQEQPSDDGSDDEETVGLLENNLVASTTRCCSPTRRQLLFLELAVLGAVLVGGLFAALSWKRHRRYDISSFSNRGGNYVLDANWDFDAGRQTREYHWTIQDVQLRPDGAKRPMIVINQQFPGPLIECNEGDTIRVQVHNQAVNSTSFHWHGLYQNGSTFMDGAVGISQCPIAPGSNMTYEFKVEGQWGTYWYHAHMAMQASDGLFGPLIVHSKEERQLQQLQYASDQIVMVQDYYHDLTSALLPHYLAPDRENVEPVPDGGLINGMNRRDCKSLRGRDCDSSNAQLATFGLEPSKNHRLRIINTGAFADFEVKIDEHPFAVTEVDGTDVLPAYYHKLSISPGQRYSIIINTNVTDRDTFWLRAKMVTACFAEENPNLDPEVRAIIHYTHSPTPPPPPTPSSTDWLDPVTMLCLDLNTTALSPLPPVAPPPPTTLLPLRTNFEIGAWRLSRGYFNTSSFRPNVTSPLLHRLLHPAPGILSASPSSELTYHLPRTNPPTVLDLLVSNFDDGSHPLHLHGHKFFLLAAGHGYPPTPLPPPPPNPLRRDTASVEAYGWVWLRVVADNPGVWAFHCHVAWHVQAGMLMAFAVGEVGEVPAVHREMCGREGVGRGMGPGDGAWVGDFGVGG